MLNNEQLLWLVMQAPNQIYMNKNNIRWEKEIFKTIKHIAIKVSSFTLPPQENISEARIRLGELKVDVE